MTLLKSNRFYWLCTLSGTATDPISMTTRQFPSIFCDSDVFSMVINGSVTSLWVLCVCYRPDTYMCWQSLGGNFIYQYASTWSNWRMLISQWFHASIQKTQYLASLGHWPWPSTLIGFLYSCDSGSYSSCFTLYDLPWSRYLFSLMVIHDIKHFNVMYFKSLFSMDDHLDMPEK